jgi:hypothetical protein
MLQSVKPDAQMSSRFPPTELPRWGESDEFRRLLHAFERLLPLKKPSSLAQRDVVEFVLAATGGIAGAIAQLLTRAAELAIRDGTERVALAHLEHVALVSA